MGFNSDQDTTDHGALTGLSDDDHLQYLLGESDNIREEHGSLSFPDPGNAADGTWNTSTLSSDSVTFGTAFGSNPVVVLGDDDIDGQVLRFNISTTGFDAQYNNYVSSNSTDAAGDWLAVGSE